MHRNAAHPQGLRGASTATGAASQLTPHTDARATNCAFQRSGGRPADPGRPKTNVLTTRALSATGARQ
eukprot:6356618-Alexandrium_andersonii.AAC.1